MSAKDDLEAIIGYLGMPIGAPEVQQITGIDDAAIADVLRGDSIGNAETIRHLEIVADVLRSLGEGRLAATGFVTRPAATAWLHHGKVVTSRGPKTPLEVLSDSDLASEALRGLRR